VSPDVTARRFDAADTTSFEYSVVVGNCEFYAFPIGYGGYEFMAQRGAWTALEDLGLSPVDLQGAINEMASTPDREGRS
jgi:hypothetical protein